MTAFVALHRDELGTFLSHSAHVPAAEAGNVLEAAALLAAARRIRDCADTETAAARTAAMEQGRAEGLAAGRAAADAEIGVRMFALERQAADERLAQRERTSELALAIVRRIAGDLGDGPLVAALAARAAEELLPGTRAVVRVPPAALQATRSRLPAWVDVIGDPSLGARDCVIETPVGRTLAGLEVQLQRLEHLFATAAPDGRPEEPPREAARDAA